MRNKLTATQFNKDPAQFYRAAYDGETVTISHDHYGQGLFELTYRKRGFKPEKEQLTDEQKTALMTSIEPALEIGLRMLLKGNVIFTGGRKHVVRTPRALLPAETFVCERPHQDEDFSYLCGSDYCRCCQ